MQQNLSRVLEQEHRLKKDGRVRNEAYKRSLDTIYDPYGLELEEEEIERLQGLEIVPESLLSMSKFRLVTKIHPLRFQDAVE